jgi:hypothetical protein
VQCAAYLLQQIQEQGLAGIRLVLLCSADNNVVGGKVRAGVQMIQSWLTDTTGHVLQLASLHIVLNTAVTLAPPAKRAQRDLGPGAPAWPPVKATMF